MISDDVKQTKHYLDALERGRAGEQYIFEDLVKGLLETPLVVRLTAQDNHMVPFDIEILDGPKIIVGIENKDLSATSDGSRIRKVSKRLKLQYAKDHNISGILTTVTRRDIGTIGWKEGLVNGHPTVFNYNRDSLYAWIKSVWQETPT